MKNKETTASFWTKFTLSNFRLEMAVFIPILTLVYIFRSYWINMNESIWVSILYTMFFIIAVRAVANFLWHFKQVLLSNDTM